MRDKPSFLRDTYPRLGPGARAAVDRAWRDALRSLLAVDEAVAGIVDQLDAVGERDDTVIVFTTDNGLFYGDHRVPAGKYLPYEPAVRVPLVISGPPVAESRRGVTTDAPVANIDLAPTFLDIAGVAPRAPMDGRSLLPLLAGEGEAGWSSPGGPWAPSPTRERPILLMGVKSQPHGLQSVTYSGVRSDGWVYIRWEDDEMSRELYDLSADPHQVQNLAGRRRHAGTIGRLERQRRLLVRCAGRSCDVPPYGYLDLPRAGALPPWFTAAQWAEQGGLGVAYGDGTFRPTAPVTRLDAVTWLWRLAGSPVVEGSDPYDDVPAHAAAGVRWAFADGVLEVTGPRLQPGRTLTRAELAGLLWRAAGRPPGTATLPIDVLSGSEEAESIRWALTDPDDGGPGVPVASGFADGRFRPGQAVNRSQAVLWLQRSAGD